MIGAVNAKEKEKLNAALSAAGYSESRIEELHRVLEGKIDPADWAEGDSGTENAERFLRRLLSGNTELSEQEAEAAGLRADARYGLLLLEFERSGDTSAARELLKQLNEDAVIVCMGDVSLVLVSEMTGKKEAVRLQTEAQKVLSTLNTELMCKLRIACGGVAEGWEPLRESYRQSQLTMEVMKRFCEERLIMDYAALGLGGLVIDLSPEACTRFLEECFGAKQHSRLSEEELQTVSRFFEHGLNISETARDLYLHRNTLVYHLEKIEKKTGLDIRRFDDAVLLKLALMIENRG